MPPEVSSNQPMPTAPTAVPAGFPTPGSSAESPDKEYVVAVLLSYAFGGFGVDRFYLGKVGTGIAKLLTFGGLGIWALIDFIMILFGSMKDKNGLPLRGYAEHGKLMKIIFGVLLGVSLLAIPLIIITMIAISIPALQQTANNTQIQLDLSSMAAALDQYDAQHHTYPTAIEFATGNSIHPADLRTIGLAMVTYKPTPMGCDAVKTLCTGFSIDLTYNGKQYHTTN